MRSSILIEINKDDKAQPMKITGNLGDMTIVDFFTIVFKYSPEWASNMQRAIDNSLVDWNTKQ